MVKRKEKKRIKPRRQEAVGRGGMGCVVATATARWSLGGGERETYIRLSLGGRGPELGGRLVDSILVTRLGDALVDDDAASGHLDRVLIERRFIGGERRVDGERRRPDAGADEELGQDVGRRRHTVEQGGADDVTGVAHQRHGRPVDQQRLLVGRRRRFFHVQDAAAGAQNRFASFADFHIVHRRHFSLLLLFLLLPFLLLLFLLLVSLFPLPPSWNPMQMRLERLITTRGGKRPFICILALALACP